MNLSVIIVTYNSANQIRPCLASVFREIEASGMQAEVFVVDNASTDDTMTLVAREFPEVRVIANIENRGFAVANNQAMRVCSGENVLLLNPDTIVCPGNFAAIAVYMQEQGDVGICGCRLVNPDGSLQISFGGSPTLASELGWALGLGALFSGRHRFAALVTDPARYAYEGDIGWACGACLWIRRRCLDRIGLLDARFLMYGEELDLCRRALDDGWRVTYTPDSTTVHFGRQSLAQREPWQMMQLYKSQYLYVEKHMGRAASVVLILAAQVGITLRVGAHWFRRLFSRRSWFIPCSGNPYAHLFSLNIAEIRRCLALSRRQDGRPKEE